MRPFLGARASPASPMRGQACPHGQLRAFGGSSIAGLRPGRARCLLTGCFSGCQEKPQGSLNTLINIMLSTLFLSRRYAAPQRKSRKPKSRKIHDPSRKKALRSPVRHLRQNRQRPRPVRGRVRVRVNANVVSILLNRAVTNVRRGAFPARSASTGGAAGPATHRRRRVEPHRARGQCPHSSPGLGIR